MLVLAQHATMKVPEVNVVAVMLTTSQAMIKVHEMTIVCCVVGQNAN